MERGAGLEEGDSGGGGTISWGWTTITSMRATFGIDVVT